jgi:WD40 repeat protein
MDNLLAWISGENIEYRPLPRDKGDVLMYSEVIKSTNAIKTITTAFEKYIVFGGFKEIRVVEIETGLFITEITGDFGWVHSLNIIYGTTTLIISGHADGSIRTWDFFGNYSAYAAKPNHIRSGHFNIVTCTSVIQGVHPMFVSGSLDGTLRVWDLQSDNALAFSFHRKGVLCISTINSSAESICIASGDEGGEVIIWSLMNNNDIKEINSTAITSYEKVNYTLKPILSIMASQVAIRSLALVEHCIALSCSILIIALDNGCICLRKLLTGELVCAWRAHETAITSLHTLHMTIASKMVSPISVAYDRCSLSSRATVQKLILITASTDSLIKIWDAIGAEMLATCRGHTTIVNSIACVRKIETPPTNNKRRMSNAPKNRSIPSPIEPSIFSLSSMLLAAGFVDPIESNNNVDTDSDDLEGSMGRSSLSSSSPPPLKSSNGFGISRMSSSDEWSNHGEDCLSTGIAEHYVICSAGADGFIFKREFTL